jgi:Phosphoinositide phospholipase C, Ca2+-dependent
MKTSIVFHILFLICTLLILSTFSTVQQAAAKSKSDSDSSSGTCAPTKQFTSGNGRNGATKFPLQGECLSLNQLQFVGVHNAYKKLAGSEISVMPISHWYHGMTRVIADVFCHATLPDPSQCSNPQILQGFLQRVAAALAAVEYGREEKLDDLLSRGVRALSLDVHVDPFVTPYLDPPHNQIPGFVIGHMYPKLDTSPPIGFEHDMSKYSPDRFKVLHAFGVDQASTCSSFSECLGLVRVWSDAHPDAYPITLFVELKYTFEIDGQPLPVPTPLTPFTVADLAVLDDAIESALGDRLIRYSDVQSNHSFPTVGDARGKVMVVADFNQDNHPLAEHYQSTVESHNRPMFVGTVTQTLRPSPRFDIFNDPTSPELKASIEAGNLVRTRSDSDTAEARMGGTNDRRDLAFSSGAHYIQTDYLDYIDDPITLVPGPGIPPFRTDYRVQFEDAAHPFMRCNPLQPEKSKCKDKYVSETGQAPSGYLKVFMIAGAAIVFLGVSGAGVRKWHRSKQQTKDSDINHEGFDVAVAAVAKAYVDDTAIAMTTVDIE